MWWDYIFGWNECGLFWLKKNTIWCNPENFASVQTWQSNLDWLDESAKWASDHHCSGLQCKITKLAQSQINKVGPMIIKLQWQLKWNWSELVLICRDVTATERVGEVKAWTQSVKLISIYIQQKIIDLSDQIRNKYYTSSCQMIRTNKVKMSGETDWRNKVGPILDY